MIDHNEQSWNFLYCLSVYHYIMIVIITIYELQTMKVYYTNLIQTTKRENL